MKRRVLRIITRLNVGGPATHVQLANAGLDARGWQTLLAFGQIDAGEAQAPIRLDIEAEQVGSLQRRVSPAADTLAFAQLIRIIRSFKPHIVHTHLSKAGLLGRTAAIGSTKALRAHTFHGNVFDGYFSPRVSQAIMGIERGLGSRTHAVVALSEAQRDELLARRVASTSQIHIVPLGIDLERFGRSDRSLARNRLGIPAEIAAVVAIGRMVPIKRLDRLVRAMVGVRAAVASSHLFMIGGGSERPALEAQVRELELDRHVTFVGWSSETEHWYGAADLVALTSAREGTPLSLIEAAAAGRPVVATAVGGVPDVVQDGVTGVVVTEGDERALAEGIISLLRDPLRAERMGRTARSRSNRFGAGRLVDDLERLYLHLLQDRRS